MVAVSPDIRLDGVDSAFLAIVEEAIARVAEGAGPSSPAARGRRSGSALSPTTPRRREQGWKLHLSAGLFSAEEVLRRALPVLLAETAAFKLAASPDALAALNEGHGGLQPGRQVPDGLPGRRRPGGPPGGRPRRGDARPAAARPSPPIARWRRAASSTTATAASATGTSRRRSGEVVPALVTPDGELVPDRRLPVYRAPEWADDPFVAAGVAVDAPAASPLVGQRYLITATLHSTPRGSIHLAVDIDAGRTCVLKRARRDGQRPAATGAMPATRLRHEAAVLARLAPDPRFPTPSRPCRARGRSLPGDGGHRGRDAGAAGDRRCADRLSARRSRGHPLGPRDRRGAGRDPRGRFHLPRSQVAQRDPGAGRWHPTDRLRVGSRSATPPTCSPKAPGATWHPAGPTIRPRRSPPRSMRSAPFSSWPRPAPNRRLRPDRRRYSTGRSACSTLPLARGWHRSSPAALRPTPPIATSRWRPLSRRLMQARPEYRRCGGLGRRFSLIR